MTDRDTTTGRFLPGNPGGPGRKPRAAEAEYLDVLTERVSLDQWAKVVDRALKDAQKGNGYARAWLSDYLIGKPPQILDIRAADAVLLRQVLEQLETHGYSASEVFNKMLARLDQEQSNGR